MQLPTVTGKNLDRKQMTFPDDFTGRVNLLFIPFKRWHQDHVDGWVPFVGKMSEEYPAMSFYEFPTLPDSNFIYHNSSDTDVQRTWRQFGWTPIEENKNEKI